MHRFVRLLTQLVLGACLAASTAEAAVTVTGSQTGRTLLAGVDSVEVFQVTVSNGLLSLFSATINSIKFENRSQGGNQTQMDQSWSRLELHVGSNTTSIASATFTGDFALFSGLNVRVAPGASVTLFITAKATVLARDGDILDMKVKELIVDNNSVGGLPDPAGNFPVNGMSSAQITVHPVSTPVFGIGSKRNLALDVTVPANGYQADQLQRLDVLNVGSAIAGSDIEAVELWSDDGNGIFDPLGDQLVGAMAFTGDRWIRGAINLSVPVAGRRMFVSVDISNVATDGHTVRLGLPTLPDVGLTMQSNNDGPLDKAAANPFSHALATVDRITLAAKPINPGVAHPGDNGLQMFQLVATNTYSVAKELDAITFTNATVGPGSIAELDGEVQTLTLREDADDDGGIGFADPVLGSALFIGGRATFSGFAWSLPAGKTRRLFLTGDVALLRAADGDALGASLVGPSDLTFANATSVSASWPLSIGAPWTIDGMRAAQVGNLGAPGVTLGPDDGPALALDLLVRRNGYQADVLTGMMVENLGTAVATDLAELHLWRDGGDGTFGAGGGDDVDLGPLAPNGGTWLSGTLAVPLGANGARLFVSATASSSPTDSSTVQLALPIDKGLIVQSGNDGPIDVEVANAASLLLTTRPLLASLTVTPAATTVGQNVTVKMRVRNGGSQSIVGVTPSALTVTGGGVSYTSGPAPASATIGPGAFQDYTWTYGTTAPDTAWFTGSATGTNSFTGQPTSSYPVISNAVRIFAQGANVQLTATSALPVNVTRGQHNVTSFFFDFEQPNASGSDVLVRAFRLRLQSESGTGIVPDDLLDRVAVRSGPSTYLDRTSLETSGDEINLTLATPILVSGNDPVTVGVSFDIDSTTTVPNFRVLVPDNSWFTSEDAVSGAPVAVTLPSQSFPLSTGLARVVEEASEVDVAAATEPSWRAGQGQTDVKLLTLQLTSPGVTGVTSDARVSTFAVRLADTLGITRPVPGSVLRRLKVRSGPQTLADRPVVPSADSLLTLILSPLISVPVNTPISVEVYADLSDTASLGGHRLVLADSMLFDARDPTTGDRIPAVYATHPIQGPAVIVEAPADSMYARGIAQLPATVAAGAAGVPAMLALLRHPGGPGSAALRIDTLVVRCVDEARNPLVPALYLDRVHVRWNGVEVANLGDPPGAGNAIGVSFPVQTIAPGDVDTLSVVLDFEASAPSTSFELTLHGSGLPAEDANTGVPATVATEEGLEFPLPSGLARIAAPARTLEAGLVDHMPPSLATDGSETPVADVTLLNTASAGSGGILINHMVIEAANAASTPVALGAVATRVALYHSGVLWAASATLSPDSTTATLGGTPLYLVPGAPTVLEVRLVPRTSSPLASFRVGFAGPDVGVVQPSNPLLVIGVQPPAGAAFPLWTATTSFAAANLEASYSNFPNPFAAGREPTTFAYYLPGPGHVSLRLWSARGEHVVSLLDNVSRGAGLHQDDAWDGRNGRGLVVTNGVYIAELLVHLDDGTSKRLVRKVAVVR